MADGPRSKRRRILRFSITTMLVLLTAFCVFLGTWVEIARQQQRVVSDIFRDGHFVGYENEGILSLDHHEFQLPIDLYSYEQHRASWIERLFGTDYARNVVAVAIYDRSAVPEAREWSAVDFRCLRLLSGLKWVWVYHSISDDHLVSLMEIESLERLLIHSYPGKLTTLNRVQSLPPDVVIMANPYDSQ